MVAVNDHGFIANFHHCENEVLTGLALDSELHADIKVINPFELLAIDFLTQTVVASSIGSLGWDCDFNSVTR